MGSGEYGRALEGASKRARWVLLITTFAVIVSASALWNSMQLSWLERRIAFASDALKEGLYDPDVKPDPWRISVRDYLEANHLMDKKRLERQLEILQERRVDHILIVRVPILGIMFDINDLGLMTGVAFSVLLLMNRHSLLSEWRCLKAAGCSSKGEYVILTLTQVLTVPESAKMHLKKLPRLLYWLPLGLQVAICINDGVTAWRGSAMDSFGTSRTLLTLALDVVGLEAVAFLTWPCIACLKEMDAWWHEMDARYGEGKAAGP